ncbi:PEP-CTERM sorting domain-containing protein [Nostoc sp. 106C]|uniref:PEP-CTERM sorting domain-containing protein n=1 Tax=Nostoc sp. 106C TaxID=1932667 RepID=UPI0011803D68|nr:PEP-CTERM sorting domain-containing protein [Nostoc sp. 106C]
MSRFGIRRGLLKLATATALSIITFQAAGSAQATTLTLTSPTSGGALSSGISPVGGIVLDLIGLNNTRVTSQLGASQLYIGYYNSGTPSAYQGNPGTIGIQSGFTPTITGALGGGLKELAVRFSLYDGDTAAGDFDENDNTLLVNNINFGNWSSVNTENTNGLGNAGGAGFSGGGFRNDTLDTGWFHVTNASTLSNFFNSLVNTQQAIYQVNDVDPYDNYYDFTQGIDSSLINVGQGPVVQPPNSVPEPITILGTLTAAGFGVALRRKQKQQQQATVKA